MSFQTIIDNATYITIDRQKVTSFTVSRSGRVKTAERGQGIYRFSVGSPQGLKYSTNRNLLEDLDNASRTTMETIDIGSTNANMAYITEYQGNLSQPQLDQIITAGNDLTVGEANIYLNTVNVTGSPSGTLFKKGDYIQPKGTVGTYPYPYTITEDIAWSSSASLRVPVHRGLLPYTADTPVGVNANPNFGKDVTFQVKALTSPTYSVVPHNLIEFSGDFEFVEIIE